MIVGSASIVLWAISPIVVIALVAVASFAVSLADSLGAFGSNIPSPNFPEIDSADAANTVDVELQAAQRRADQRRSVLAGGGEDINVGFATVLGPQNTQPQTPPATFLG